MADSPHCQAVPITGYTSLSSAGFGNAELYQALLNNQRHLAPLDLFEVNLSTYVGEVTRALPDVRSELAIYNSRNSRMALAALDNPKDDLRLAIEMAKIRYGRHRIGVVIGTSTSGLYETESAYEFLLEHGQMPKDFHFLTRHAYQATPRFLQQELELQGICFAISTACSSAAKAIAAGQRLINHHLCDAVLVGGIDTLCQLTLRGFHSLELISSDYCRPLDKNRQGINIGEGAGLLLLEKPSEQFKDCPKVLAVGESSDAYHMSSPHPEGKGAILAMQQAMQLAGCQMSDIDYINLHATATPMNDSIETIAVKTLFSESVACSGTKGIMGHTLGAAGAIEAIVALLALEYQFIPGTCGLLERDENNGCQIIIETLTEQPLNTVMSNSFGFGGNNASMIFSR